MNILCLEGKYIDTLDSLKDILNKPIDPTSSLSDQISDIVNSGRLLQWLEQRCPTEDDIIAKIKKLSQNTGQTPISTSELLNSVVSVFTQKESNVCKPDFSKYAKISKVEKREGSHQGLFSFTLHIDVIEPINETYNLGVKLSESDQYNFLSSRISLDVDEGCKEICVDFEDIMVDISATPIIVQVDNNVVGKIIPKKNTGASAHSINTLPTPINRRKYQVGDYFDDGLRQGIVFWVDETGYNGKIVSLDEGYLEWQDKGKSIKTAAYYRRDGMANKLEIQKIPGWEAQFPAVKWCEKKGPWWYLPAIEELRELLRQEAVAIELRHIGNPIATYYNTGYWSSTEVFADADYASTISSGYNNVNNDIKSRSNRVRAISAFYSSK